MRVGDQVQEMLREEWVGGCDRFDGLWRSLRN